jgi:hypothetical protein
MRATFNLCTRMGHGPRQGSSSRSGIIPLSGHRAPTVATRPAGTGTSGSTSRWGGAAIPPRWTNQRRADLIVEEKVSLRFELADQAHPQKSQITSMLEGGRWRYRPRAHALYKQLLVVLLILRPLQLPNPQPDNQRHNDPDASCHSHTRRPGSLCTPDHRVLPAATRCCNLRQPLHPGTPFD